MKRFAVAVAVLALSTSVYGQIIWTVQVVNQDTKEEKIYKPGADKPWSIDVPGNYHCDLATHKVDDGQWFIASLRCVHKVKGKSISPSTGTLATCRSPENKTGGKNSDGMWVGNDDKDNHVVSISLTCNS